MSETIDTSELKKIAYEVNRDILNGPNILPYLLAGGAGALVGGAATAIQPRGKDESRLRRLYRVLRNAALLGGAVGGGSALIGNAAKTVDTALPAEDKVMTEGIGDVLGSRELYKHGIPAAMAAKMYSNTYKKDQAGLGRYLESIMGPAYGADPIHEYKDYTNRVNSGTNDALKEQHPHKRWADRITEVANRNKLDAAHVTTDAAGNATRHIPIQDPEEVLSKLRSHGFSPDPYKPNSSKFLRRIGDAVKMHGGRIAGRSTAAKAFRLPALAAGYLAPDFIADTYNDYNSTDPSLYE